MPFVLFYLCAAPLSHAYVHAEYQAGYIPPYSCLQSGVSHRHILWGSSYGFGKRQRRMHALYDTKCDPPDQPDIEYSDHTDLLIQDKYVDRRIRHDRRPAICIH